MADLFSGDPKNPTALKLFERLSGAEAARAEAKSRQNIANFKAELKKREAEAERAKARFAQKRQAKRGARVKASLTADIAAAGGLGSPVAADLAVEQAVELELENLLIGFESEARAKAREEESKLLAIGGKFEKQKGKNLATARNVEFGTKLLTGFA